MSACAGSRCCLNYDHYNRGSTFSRPAFDAGQVSQVYANAPAGSLFYGDPGDLAFLYRSKAGELLSSPWPRLQSDRQRQDDLPGRRRPSLRLGRRPSFRTAWSLKIRPYGPQVTLTSGPYQFSNPWGNVPGGNPFPLPTPSKNVAFPLANAEVFLPPHIHSPSVGQWNASVQHRFSDNWVFSISYLGNKTSHLWIGNEINPAVYIPGTCGSAACSIDRQHPGQARPVAG